MEGTLGLIVCFLSVVKAQLFAVIQMEEITFAISSYFPVHLCSLIFFTCCIFLTYKIDKLPHPKKFLVFKLREK